MADVQRWGLVLDEWGRGSLRPQAEGAWVHHSDYATKVAKLEFALAAERAIVDWIAKHVIAISVPFGPERALCIHWQDGDDSAHEHWTHVRCDTSSHGLRECVEKAKQKEVV